MGFPLREFCREFLNQKYKKQIIIANIIAFIVFSMVVFPMVILFLILMAPIYTFLFNIELNFITAFLVYAVFFWIIFFIVKIKIFSTKIYGNHANRITLQQIYNASQHENPAVRKDTAKLIGFRKDQSTFLKNILKTLEDDENYKVREQAKNSIKRLERVLMKSDFDNKLAIDLTEQISFESDKLNTHELEFRLKNNSNISPLEFKLKYFINGGEGHILNDSGLETIKLGTRSKLISKIPVIDNISDILKINNILLDPKTGQVAQGDIKGNFIQVISIENVHSNSVNVSVLKLDIDETLVLTNSLIPKGILNNQDNKIEINNFSLDPEESISFTFNYTNDSIISQKPNGYLTGSIKGSIISLDYEFEDIIMDLNINSIIMKDESNYKLSIDIHNKSDIDVNLHSLDYNIIDGHKIIIENTKDLSNLALSSYQTQTISHEFTEEINANCDIENHLVYSISTKINKITEIIYKF
jgi:hypothetical protein